MFLQFTKFIGVGALATGIHYAILIALVEQGHTDAVTASTIGYAISGVVNYLLNYYFTFSSQEKHSLAALKFTLVAGTGLALNSLIMYLAIVLAGIYYLLGQVMATIIVLFWNYLANRYWTYKSRHPGSQIR